MAPKVRGRQLGSTRVASAGGGGPSSAGSMIPAGATSSTGVVSMDSADLISTEESGGPPTISAPAHTKPRTRGSSEPRTPVAATPQQQEQRFGKRGSGQAFALGLFKILKTEDPSIIGWSESGKAFRIGDSERFCKDIMPRFFKQNKYSSFQRQLNLYGFRKLVRGNEAGGYMHPLFERGKPEQLSQVRRGFFPEIPPEFAHDVHGHGLGEPTAGDAPVAAATGTPSRAAPRGRKSETPGHRPTGSNGSVSGTATSIDGNGSQPARSSSVGRSGRPSGMSAAASAAAAAVTAAAVPGTVARGVLNGKAGLGVRVSPPGAGAGGRAGGGGRGEGRGGIVGRREQGHVRSGSASVVMEAHGQVVDSGMVVDSDWEGVDGPLPSLDLVTSGLRLPGRHGNGIAQAAGAEMPPTLGRLGDPHESSPMKGDGRMRQHRRHGSTNMEPPDRHVGHSLPYGRSQDDLSVGSPRTPYGHIMGMAHASVGDTYDRKAASGYYKQQGRPGHASDYYGSNGSVASGSSHGSHRSHRPLQHLHSRDDLDALRPRKTRRTGASYHSGQGQAAEDANSFMSGSPRADDGAEGFDHGNGVENGIPFLASSAVSYAAPDEVPPAPPRRLVSRHNTPSRPERSGASNKSNGGGSSSIGGGGSSDSGSGHGHGHQMHLGDPNAMETEGGNHLPGLGPGMGGRNRGNNFAAQGFFAAVSPVAVSAASGGFPGGRRHRRLYSNGGAQQGSGGGSALSDGYGGDSSGVGRAGPGWRLGETSPEEAAVMRGDSPASSRSGGGGGGSAAGGGMGGLGLTAHAMSRMEQVKTNRHDPMQPGDASQSTQLAYRGSNNPNGQGTGGGPNGNGVAVQALGENLSQLDLGETGVEGLSQASVGDRDNSCLSSGIGNNGVDHARGSGGGVGPAAHYDSQRRQQQQQQQRPQHHDLSHKQRHLQQQTQQRQHPHYTQPLSSGERGGGAGGAHKRGTFGMGLSPGRRPTAAEAAELLRRRSSVDEVIGLLSAPAAADGGFEDECTTAQHYDPAQYDSWRNSLTKVLGHLGFDFEDEHGVPVQGQDGKRSPAKCISSRGTSQCLSWGGTSAMSFEEQPEEFHESLRQIPMRWRSSLSSIMTSMASNGGGDEVGGGQGGGAADGMGVGSDGKRVGEHKRLEQQASLEMLQSVMRETLESISQGAEHGDAEDGEAEAKAAAAAALAMGSMFRANTNGTGSGSGTGSGGGGGTLGNTVRRGGVEGQSAGMRDAYGVSSGMRDAAVDSRSTMESPGTVSHHQPSHNMAADTYHNSRKPRRSGTHLQEGGGYRHVIVAPANGAGAGMQHEEHHTSF